MHFSFFQVNIQLESVLKRSMLFSVKVESRLLQMQQMHFFSSAWLFKVSSHLIIKRPNQKMHSCPWELVNFYLWSTNGNVLIV